MLTRRKFAEAAAAAGAVLAFGKVSAAAPAWRERRDLYPQGDEMRFTVSRLAALRAQPAP